VIRYILARSGQAMLSMLAVTFFVFGIVRLSGDPLQVLLPVEASRQQYDEMRRMLYLDQPLYVQYGIWMSRALVGDFGLSTKHRLPVSQLVGERLPSTLALSAVAFPLTIILGLTIGVYAAAYRNSALDVAARTFAVIGQAAPNFWMGIVLIMIFAVWAGWLPAGGKDDWRSYILPAITLGWYPVAGVMRLTRSSMIEVLGSEYVKLARVKGVSENKVLWTHAFKNAALPVLTFSALVFIFMIRGSVIVETVFAWPGIGGLVLEAVYNRDFPIVQAVVLMFSSWVIFGNLLVDVLYAFLNPRIRY
jgi:peptide/nickel transport system permease protein